jgi:UDP-glucose:(heptosyl)LPS alpha-1,3-glucosyltransferase
MSERGGLLRRISPRCRTYRKLEEAVFGPDAKAHILCLTEEARQQYMRQYGTPAERFHLLPPGISRTAVDWPAREEIRRRIRAELGLEAAEIFLLMVGSGYRTKGVDRSIEALAGLPAALRGRCRLYVIGQGKAAPLQRLAARLGVADRVRFLGARNDVPRYLLGADLLLHPSVTEAAGMVLLEAMLAGLPILASEVCGYGFHIVRAGAGLLAPEPFAVAEFGRRLEAMLTSPELSVWSQNGRRYAESADLFSLAERAADIIEQIRGAE